MHQPLCQRPTDRGGSLLDMLVVLVIVMTLASLMRPSLNRHALEKKALAESQHLFQGLRRARLAAMTQNLPTMACPSEDGATCASLSEWHHGWMVFEDPRGLGQPNHPDDILEVGGPSELLILTSGSRKRTRFNPDGSAYGYNLTISACQKDDQIIQAEIIVSNPGRVRWSAARHPLVC